MRVVCFHIHNLPHYRHKLCCKVRCSSSHLLFMNVPPFLYKIHTKFFYCFWLIAFAVKKAFVPGVRAFSHKGESDTDINLCKSVSGVKDKESNFHTCSRCHIMGGFACACVSIPTHTCVCVYINMLPYTQEYWEGKELSVWLQELQKYLSKCTNSVL